MLLPTDLKKLREYLVQEGEKSAQELIADNKCVQSYRTLIEVTYCRVMLLCHKRPGELQRITVDGYNEAGVNGTYEEFDKCVSPTEAILCEKF